MNISKKLVIQIIASVFITYVLFHWITAGQDEIINNEYAPKTESSQVIAQPTAAKRLPSLPKTLAGYKRSFAKLPASTWGGGDVGVTTVLRDGRAVWFFGDTLTRRGGTTWLLRNTALVQTGEKMHAANYGIQIIPTRRGVVFWPLKVDEVKPGLIKVWTSKIVVGHSGPWDFARVRKSEARTALVRVDKSGDMKFVRWSGWTSNPTDKAAAPPDGSDLRVLGKGHWGYLKMVHYDLPLRGGKHLVTESQNWDNGHKRTTDYRLMLSAR